MSVGMNIRTLREMKELTQQEFADLLGVTKETVSRWETGKMAVRDRHIAKMTELFGIDREDITSESFGIFSQSINVFPKYSKPVVERFGKVFPPNDNPKPAYAPLLGRVHAGDAQEPEVLDDRVPVPYEVLQNHKRAYFLEVEGDCMSRVYPEGCRVLIDPDRAPQSGSIAVVSIDGADYIMRRMLVGAQTLVLSPESYSDEWEDIVIKSDEHTVEMVGTVVWYQPAKEME